MKKILGIIAMAVVALVMAASCGSSDRAAEVARKIQSGDTLTQSEYTTVIDYLGHFAEKAQPLQDQINNLPYGDAKAAELQQQLDELKTKNTYLDLFRSTLSCAPQAQIGADNVALVNKYAGYEWFSAPDWATVITDPANAGVELETPASDTTGVVAGAVDELKVKSGI